MQVYFEIFSIYSSIFIAIIRLKNHLSNREKRIEFFFTSSNSNNDVGGGQRMKCVVLIQFQQCSQSHFKNGLFAQIFSPAMFRVFIFSLCESYFGFIFPYFSIISCPSQFLFSFLYFCVYVCRSVYFIFSLSCYSRCLNHR